MSQVHAGAGEHLAASGPALPRPRPRPRHARPALAERGVPREAGAQGGGRGRVHHGGGQRAEERQEPRQQGHQLTHRLQCKADFNFCKYLFFYFLYINSNVP